MEYRQFGKTDLKVITIGFGAWGIGGTAMAGDIPIGWGEVDDRQSVAALKTAFDRGINFFDTADFYGLGHSEELIGKTFGNRPDVLVATKVGHVLDNTGAFSVDYSGEHILEACHASLKRLKRETIDYYQLHSARIDDLRKGECIEAMEQLKKEGKIRYWGLSLNTFSPEPEADFLIDSGLADGFQIVFNLINQRGWPVIRRAYDNGYGVIARMPLQFGLLTGKFDENSRFEKNDHRAFRLPPDVLAKSIEYLRPVWERVNALSISKTSYSLSFCAGFKEISTVIPGIKTPEQAILNTTNIAALPEEEIQFLQSNYKKELDKLLDILEKQG
jgi:aryl-alcohol dehydrogenase-like predicted oxidoreductase